MKKKLKHYCLSTLVAISLINGISIDIKADYEYLYYSPALILLPIAYKFMDVSKSSSNKIVHERKTKHAITQKISNDLKPKKNIVLSYTSWDDKDYKLKNLLDKKLGYLKLSKNSEKLYADIDDYIPENSKDTKHISLDISRSFLPNTNKNICKNLEPIVSKVLLYSHSKTRIPYYQGFNFVCMGLAYLIHNYYPNLDKNMTMKLCSYLYFSILPDLQRYSSIFSNYIDDNKLHPIIRKAIEKLSNEFKEKNIKKEDIENHVKCQCATTFCSYGIPTIKTKTGECNYSSIGSKLVKDLIFHSDNIIDDDSLEKAILDVLCSQSYEYISSYPRC